MSFQSPSLDDRTFQQLVSEAKRLIPRHTPEWTNHNVADPGVALLELFAWMTESTIYRLNQVPDRWYVKFLELVGIQPYAAVPARTLLTFWLSAPQPEPVIVPPGTQVGTLQTDERPSVVFTTEAEVQIVQPHLVACLTEEAGSGEYVDRFDDLRAPAERVACFPGLRLDDAFYLGFAESCAANVLYLDITAKTMGIGIDPHRPPLVWETWDGDRWVAAEIEKPGDRPGAAAVAAGPEGWSGGDRTGGLNRDGSIVMYLPLAHEAATLGGRRAYWLRARLIEGDPTFEASPEIGTVRVQSLGGRARASHGVAAPAEALGRSDGEPGQVFRVEHTPVLPRRGDQTVRVITADGATTWEEVGHFGNSGPDDRHFVWDSATGEIRFGPRVRDRTGTARQHGAIPPRDSEITVSGYRYGGGEIGNVGAGAISVMRSTLPFVERAENRRRASGGVDPETVDNAKKRGPLTLATGGRAVTAADFERLTIEAARSVARAKCPRVEDPRKPIRVLVVPRVDVPPDRLTLDDVRLDDDLVDDIADYLGERKLLGRRVVIGEPEYAGVSIVARVVAEPGSVGGGPDDDDVGPSQLKALQQRCLESLYGFIDPLKGGPEGTGWPFGWDLHAGGLFQRLVSIPGIEQVEDVLIFKADPLTGERSGQALDRYELPELSLFFSVRHYVLVLPEEVRRPA